MSFPEPFGGVAHVLVAPPQQARPRRRSTSQPRPRPRSQVMPMPVPLQHGRPYYELISAHEQSLAAPSPVCPPPSSTELAARPRSHAGVSARQQRPRSYAGYPPVSTTYPTATAGYPPAPVNTGYPPIASSLPFAPAPMAMPIPHPPRRWGRVSGPLGPPQYRHMNVRFDRPPGGTMENGMRYEYSSMTGRRKALLIGINYVGSKAELKGCWNDVAKIRKFIMQSGGFLAQDMVILTDQSSDPRARPTRANMTAAMHWLVKGAKPGDSLFFHYSGHGTQAKAKQGDEADGLNECIVPIDYAKSGPMEDDELHAIMVRPLPVGCRLTALFDSCHSGTVLDLPYIYAASGKILEPDVAANVGSGLEKALRAYAKGNIMDVAKDVMATMTQAQRVQRAQEITIRTRSSGADVVMFSGCKDSETSADTYEAHKATGALSHAWVTVFDKWPAMTYLQLLNALRDELVERFHQKPQISSSHPYDLNTLFTI